MDLHLPPHSGRDLSVGTRVCLLVAALLVVAAVYLLVSPLERPSSQGPPFDCGTALAPARGDFAASVCGHLNQRRQIQAGMVGLAAAVLVAGGFAAFGVPRRRRRVERPDDPGASPPSAWRAASPESESWSSPPARSIRPPALPPGDPPVPRASTEPDAEARSATPSASEAGAGRTAGPVPDQDSA